MHRVIIIGHNNQGSKKIITQCLTENPKIQFKVFITQGIYYKKSFIGSIFELLKKSSFLFSFYRMLDLIQDSIQHESLVKWCRKNKVEYEKTKDINSAKCRSIITRLDPDLIVSTFTTHILSKELILLSRIGTIGTHPSRIPEYRGLEVFFWQLANNEKTSAISIFTMTDKIDEGKLIEAREFIIDANETVRSLYEKISIMTAERMSFNISKILDVQKIEVITNTNEKSSYYGMPDRNSFKKFRKSGRSWR